jgi:glycine cleavage system H lipoate-binding protein
MGKEITNEQLFEFMTKIYSDLDGKIVNMNKEMQEGFKEIREEIKGTKDRVIIIEQEHGKKLDALFDGYKQNSEKLDMIEKEVSRHEEIILRRIK